MNGAEYLSPNYRANQVDLTKLDDRIRVYEDQIRGWFLEPAKALLPVPNSAFAVLHILMGYFEHHAIYRYGKSSHGQSGQFFSRGFTSVFPKADKSEPAVPNPQAVSEWLADAMYSDARCGLFHGWMARKRIAVTDAPELIRAYGRPGHITRVVINVGKFLDRIEIHFAEYVRELKDPTNTALRTRFNKGWESRTQTPTGAPKRRKK
jgi:hypothetical protein